MTDFFESAKAEMKAEAEAQKLWDEAKDWAPDKDKDHPNPLAGYMLDVRRVPTRHGFSYLCLVQDYDDEDVYWKVWGSRTSVKNGLEAAQPARGSAFAIEYHGKEKVANDSSRSFFRYTVRAETPDRELWQNLFRSEPQAQRASTPDFGPEHAPF